MSAVSKDNLQKIQRLARNHGGCHVCGKPGYYKWIADHIPPRELKDSIKSELGMDLGQYELYPQCQRCSSAQSGLVNRLNSGKVEPSSLNSYQTKLICGGSGDSTTGSSSDASWNKRAEIQALGEANRCHSCGQGQSLCYIGDHYPPKDFYADPIRLAVESLDLDLPQCELRAHCPKCSNEQGGEISALRAAISSLM